MQMGGKHKQRRKKQAQNFLKYKLVKFSIRNLANIRLKNVYTLLSSYYILRNILRKYYVLQRFIYKNDIIVLLMIEKKEQGTQSKK